MAMRPIVVRNPSRDPAFQRAIDELLESGVTDPSAAEAALRPLFPRVVVRARDLANESTAVRYAYREGRWTPGD
jgi:hypothetical protein